jgi:hypothetical protein
MLNSKYANGGGNAVGVPPVAGNYRGTLTSLRLLRSFAAEIGS